MFDALIFDLDGLLVNTELPYHRAWKELFQRHGQELPMDQWLLCLGRMDVVDFWDVLEERCGQRLDRAALKPALKAAFMDEVRAHPEPMPGVRRLLADMRGRGILAGLASTSDDRWVYGMLKVVGLEDAFQAVVTSSDVKHGKPAPDVYLRCAGKLGVDPARCLALEDSCYGLQAAKAAKMTCYVVPSELTCQQDLSLADGRLDSLEDLDLDRLSDPDASLAEAPAP